MKRISRCWSVAIFAARESVETLRACVTAVLDASGGNNVVIDVLVNGNRALANQAAQLGNLIADGETDAVVRVWFISVGDKAHTWNEYIHRIWDSGDVGYFIDGYAEVRPDALQLLDDGLRGARECLGATGVPTSGRSAPALKAQLLKEGGIHGNLYAIRGEVIAQLRQRSFRMPLGLYRTDSLIGAVLMFGLSPAQYEWNPKRMLVHPKATWYVSASTWWMPKDMLSRLKRKVRQAQGHLENRAVREHLAVNKLAPEMLPPTIGELVFKWAENHRRSAKRLFIEKPLTSYALKKMRQPRDWSGTVLPPVLLATISANEDNQAMSTETRGLQAAR